MANRSCPFCGHKFSSCFGVRTGIWARCANCHSIFRDINSDEFAQLHGAAFNDEGFVESVLAADGSEPNATVWDELDLPGNSFLEIGPGTGHLLAAARQSGRAVAGVESSDVHRAFIRETWGIESLYASVSDIPGGELFDAIAAVNVLEHVYDIGGFLRSLRSLLSADGILFISTCNAVSAEANVLRTLWAMCRVPDHVSVPSISGMAQAARQNGFEIEKIWSSELAFEFPVSALLAARDWVRTEHSDPEGGADQSNIMRGKSANVSIKRRLAQFYRLAAPFDPTSRVLGTFGRAATVKARLRLTG